MFPIRGKISKVVILRPGALGDVLAVRSVIRFVKDSFPGAEICLAAPGERGALFNRPGWADRCFDWDRAAFSWLFSESAAPPPPALRAVFAGCNWLLSYVDAADGAAAAAFEERLDRVAPGAGKVFCPSRPPAGHRESIGAWLAKAAAGFCQRYGLMETGAAVDWAGLCAARIRLPELVEPPPGKGKTGKYIALHPGSGSAKKNWPLDNFIAVGRMALEYAGPGCGVAVVSGEADGDAGARLAGAFPGAVHLRCAALETLAQVLAHAWLYVGNDSGVSHLAGAVESASGRSPAKAVVFGPSDARVWAPPGALVLDAGEGMDKLPPAKAWRAIAAFLAEKGEG